MEYLIRFIPLLAFLYPFVKSIKRKNAIAIIITGLFVLSAVSSLFMNSETLKDHNFESDSGWVFLLYSLLLLPFLLASLEIRPITNIHVLPRGVAVDILIACMCCGAVYSIIYLLPYAVTGLAMKATDVRIGESRLPKSISTTIAVGFPTFYYIYIFFFFTTMVQRRSKIVVGSMLLGFLAFIVNVFTISGRDGVFLGGIGLLLGFYLFKPLLASKQRKLFRMIFMAIAVIGLLLVMQITSVRFNSGGGINASTFKDGILSYFGMQPFVFSDWIKNFSYFDYGKSHFELFLNLFGTPVRDNGRELYGSYMWKFGTFLTAFYQVAGYISLFGLSFLFWLYFKLGMKKSFRLGTLSLFFFLSFYFTLIVSGLFYFRLGNEGGNLFILLSVMAVFLLKKRRIKLTFA